MAQTLAATTAAAGATSVTVDDDGATVWRVSDGYDLDRYLFRSSSPVDFSIALTFGENFGPYDADGRPLPDSPLYNEPFTLTLRAYDVDEEQGEVDQLYVNGEELVGGTLSGANNQWSINSFSVPGRMLKLYAPIPQLAVNDFEIAIDVNNGGWAVEIDWAELRFDGGGPLPVMLNHGITGGRDEDDNGCADSSQEPRTIVENAYSQVHDITPEVARREGWVTCPVSSLNGTAEYNATVLGSELEDQAEKTGVPRTDVFAHAMGGLNSRILAHRYTDQVRSIIMFGTPNAGSQLADRLCNLRAIGSNANSDMGPCELPDDDADLNNDPSGGLYQLRPSYVRNVFNDAYPDLASVAYRVYGGYKGGWGSGILNGQDDGVVELSSVYWLRPEGTSARFLEPQGPEHAGLHEPGDVVDNTHSQLWAADSDALPLATCYRWPTTCDTEAAAGSSMLSAATAESAEVSTLHETLQLDAVDIPAGAEVTVFIPAQDSAAQQQVMVFTDGDVDGDVDGVALLPADVFGQPVLVGEWTPSPDGQAVLTLTNNDPAAAMSAGVVVTGDTAATVSLDVPQYATAGDPVDVTVTSSVGADVPVTLRVSGTDGSTQQTVLTPTSGTAAAQLTGLVPGVYEAVATTDEPQRTVTEFFTVVRSDVTIDGGAVFRRFDDDGNSLFDRVTATVDVTVPEATDVRVVGQLATDTGSLVVGGIGRAPLTGTGPVTVTFDASPLYATGHSGPWHLVRVLAIDDTTDRVLAQRQFAGASPYWSADSWERDLVTIGETFTDQGVDVDGDGQYDQLQVDGILDVLEAATYDINARLVTQSGQQLGEYQTVRYLDAGTVPLRLAFPGLPIGESGVDGPYIVADLSVYPSARPDLLAYATGVHTSAPYRSCEFAGGQCSVTFYTYTEALINASDTGELTSNGILASLAAKVRAAQSAHERGDTDAVAGTLGALEQELQSINDKHITPEARSLLLDLLAQLRASL